MVYGELGRYPLLLPHMFVVLSTGFVYCIWNRADYLIRPTACFLISTKKRKQCWATEVQELLCKTGIYFVWLQQGVGDVKSFLYIFKQRLLDMFTQEWTSDIRDKERYEMYRSFKVISGAEKQQQHISVIDIYCFRVALTQLRLGVLPVNSNM